MTFEKIFAGKMAMIYITHCYVIFIKQTLLERRFSIFHILDSFSVSLASISRLLPHYLALYCTMSDRNMVKYLCVPVHRIPATSLPTITFRRNTTLRVCELRMKN